MKCTIFALANEKLRLPFSIRSRKLFSTGEVLEWLKRHAWKACKRLKRFGGSNPPLSANWLQDDFKMVVKTAFKISENRCKTYTYNDFSLYISLHSDG